MMFLNPSRVPGNASLGMGAHNLAAAQTGLLTHRSLASQILRGSDVELQQQWGPLLPALRSLSKETSSRIFYSDLYRLAHRAERQGSSGQAYALYQGLLNFPQTPDATRHQAKNRIDVIQGSGPIAARIEQWGNQLWEMASDPAMIIGMGIGGLAFRGGRLLSLSRLAGTRLPSMASRSLATLGGLGTESLAFTLTTKGVRSLIGHPESWNPQTLKNEFLSTGILLGFLRLTHSPLSYLSQGNRLHTLARHAGTYGGIVLGHHFQAAAGFRDSQKTGDLLIESLATFFQFAAGGAVARRVLGSRLTRLETRLENQIKTIENSRPPINFGDRPLPGLAWAHANIPAVFSQGRSPTAPFKPWVMMEALKGASSHAPHRPIPTPNEQLTRRIDQTNLPQIRVIQAHGRFWVLHQGESASGNGLPIFVNGRLLRPGDSLPINNGEIIRKGELSYQFQQQSFNGRPAATIQGAHLIDGVNGSSVAFKILLNDFVEPLKIGQELRLTEGLANNLRLRLLRKATAHSWTLSVEAGTQRGEFHLSKQENAFVIGQRDFSNISPNMQETLYEWIGAHAAYQAKTIRVENINRAELSRWEFYLNSDYSKLELHSTEPDGSIFRLRGKISEQRPLLSRTNGNQHWVLEIHPDMSLMPKAWGHTHQSAARRSFDQWVKRKTGLRLPDWAELKNGTPPLAINRLEIGHSRTAILTKLLRPGSRFLEIGYGKHLGTMQAAEALGARVEGIELNESYPPEVSRKDIESGPIDVLHVNGSPFLFYHRHQATLPPALSILNNFSRADWVVLQGYNPRTPLEMLRHAELIHDIEFQIQYYQSVPSKNAGPVFPTEHGGRPETHNTVLIARRVTAVE